MRGVRWMVVLALLVTGACVACNGSDAELVNEPSEDAGADTSAPRDAATDGMPKDASSDVVVDAPSDAPKASVRVGVEPEPRVGDEEPALALRIAQLESLSAGSRAVAIDVRWDELVDDQLQLQDAALDALKRRIQLLRDAGATLSLCIALVERAVDARPSNALGWNTSSMRSAVRVVIDAVLDLTGDELRFLSLGLESDRYYRALPQALRAGFVQGMQSALDYARSHPSLPPLAKVGIGLTYDGWHGPASPFATWIRSSDALVVSYVPLDAGLVPEPPSVVVSDLDTVYNSLVEIYDGGAVVPIVLHRVGYPSSFEASATQEQQRTFYASLFQALEGRRGRFPFVSVYGLNDPAPQRCADFRLTLGGDALAHPERAEAVYCSLGLHDRDGVAKPAWGEMLAGLATFASP